jgi:dephospho-CoA kinase
LELTPNAAKRSARPVVIGVLGGIASGKSLVAKLLAGRAGRVIEADALVAEVYAEPGFRAEVAREFGEGVLSPDGSLDRREIARLAFAEPQKRAWLEARIHPTVRVRIAEELERARRERSTRVVLDVPLLLENDHAHGLVARCDRLVFVDSQLEERERRAARARGWPLGEVARREAAQFPLDLKRRRANVVIANVSDRAALERKVARAERELALDELTP